MAKGKGLSKPPYVSQAEWDASKGNPRKRYALLKRAGQKQQARAHGLKKNFLRLAKNMISNGVPANAAYDKAKEMQDLQAWYLPRSLTHNPKVAKRALRAREEGEPFESEDWESFQDEYDAWFKDLEKTYGYDINELYPREANE